MRGHAVKSLPLLGVLAAAVCIPGAAVGSAESAAGKATILVSDPSPIVVTGRGFRERERVTVKITSAGVLYRKVVVASPAGRLTARWSGAALSDCSPFTVTASGSRGSQAMVRRLRIPPPCGIADQP